MTLPRLHLPLKGGGRRAKRAGWGSYGNLREADPHPNPPPFRGRERTAGGARISLQENPNLASGAQRAEAMRDHLFQDMPLDRLVGRGRIAPEPAVTVHRLRGLHEAVGHRVEIAFSVVEREDQPAAADPAQREPPG